MLGEEAKGPREFNSRSASAEGLGRFAEEEAEGEGDADDVVRKGSKITFTAEAFGLGFFVGQRKVCLRRTQHPLSDGRPREMLGGQ